MLDSKLGAVEVDSSFPPDILTSGRVSDYTVGRKLIMMISHVAAPS